jgi:hypothetical protein
MFGCEDAFFIAGPVEMGEAGEENAPAVDWPVGDEGVPNVVSRWELLILVGGMTGVAVRVGLL